MKLTNRRKIHRFKFAIIFATTLFFVFSAGAETMKKNSLKILSFENLPEIGKYHDYVIKLGGFSALEFVKATGTTLTFRTVTDRGPNGENIKEHPKWGKNIRPFLLPDFSPQIVEFDVVDFANEKAKIDNIKQISLTDDQGKPTRGLPPFAQDEKNPKNIEKAVTDGRVLEITPNGFDSEGLCTDFEGKTWLADEYYPSLLVFGADKKLLQRLLPEKDFPYSYSQRKANRGFEGLACDEKFVYAMLQSPIRLEKKSNPGAKPNKKIIRILRFDIKTVKPVDQFIYPLQSEDVDKVGDIALVKNKADVPTLFVIEQNGKIGKQSQQYIFKIELLKDKSVALDQDPEFWKAEELKKKLLTKQLVADFKDSLVNEHEKLEGLAVHDNHVFVLEDNDFGVEVDEKETLTINPNKKSTLIYFEIDKSDSKISNKNSSKSTTKKPAKGSKKQTVKNPIKKPSK